MAVVVVEEAANGESTLLPRLAARALAPKFACNAGQSEEKVRRCCLRLSSRDNAVTPKSAVEDAEEDMALCIESGRDLDRRSGFADRTAAAPPKLNRCCEGAGPSAVSEADIAALAGPEADKRSDDLGRRDVEDGRGRSCKRSR